MVRPKKIPQRMCVGCGEMKEKRALIRVVRTPDGQVVLDTTGKKSGRGAYLCPNHQCLNKAVKAKRLEKALRHPVAPEIIETLLTQIGDG
ncbi:MAG: YlxR family protein [Heliobacteriaceae bacterium]|nr:YlxR family protein [Heliobacteriaceae bacterium]MDD4588418.1 YlxR family protein [Heliobacteriaceae bacterium]